MLRPTLDDIFLSTYTFRFREEEFNPIEISHSSWSTCAIISIRGRTYDTPTATTVTTSEATQGKRPKNKQPKLGKTKEARIKGLGPKFEHEKVPPLQQYGDCAHLDNARSCVGQTFGLGRAQGCPP
jgi:hypothetical protein